MRRAASAIMRPSWPPPSTPIVPPGRIGPTVTASAPRLLARPRGRRRSIASRSARLYGGSLRSRASAPRLLARPRGRRRSIASRSARLYGGSLRSRQIISQHAAGLPFAVRVELAREVDVREREDRDLEQARVDRAGLADLERA